MRAIRGAITVSQNSEKEILDAASILFKTIVDMNDLKEEEIVSVIFSVTKDLNASYPARAVRELGYRYTPLFDVQEMDVVGSLPKTIRVMIFIDRDTPLDQVNHVYLRDAVKLRPDLLKGEEK